MNETNNISPNYYKFADFIKLVDVKAFLDRSNKNILIFSYNSYSNNILQHQNAEVLSKFNCVMTPEENN